MEVINVIFFIISAITIASAVVVAVSKDLVHSAFALLGVFAGVLGLYILLSADFVAVVQLVVYIGGILILILFAVMLTTKIDRKNGKRIPMNRAMEPVVALIGVAILGFLLFKTIIKGGWLNHFSSRFVPMTAAIGNKLLSEYLLPFEIVSLLLVLVLVGAVVLARREVK